MEQIGDSAVADDLLRSLYDWNIYGAGYSIAEGRASRVSADMQTVILAMFAERHWDLITATAQRATDTLRLIGGADAIGFLQAPSLEAVLDKVRQMDGQSNWFPEWQQLFTRKLGCPAETQDIIGLAASDSVIGWTASNVLRRLTLSGSQVAEIRAFLDLPNATVQWRAVHVLGVYPSEDNCVSLFACLAGESTNVRFGAIRSLVEMAARGSVEFSNRVFSEIAGRVAMLRSHSTTLAEFERAIFVQPDKAPAGWTRAASMALIALQETSVGVEERDRWDQALSKMVNTYGI